MNRITAAEARKAYTVWLRYQDGTEGIVDLSENAGRGVFSAWEDREVFEAVEVTPEGHLAWPGDIDLCADSLYLELKGKQAGELFSKLARTAGTHQSGAFTS